VTADQLQWVLIMSGCWVAALILIFTDTLS
jgi:hypothetical protein